MSGRPTWISTREALTEQIRTRGVWYLLVKCSLFGEALMMLAVLNILVALFLGYGAVEEFWIRGVRGGETQPLVVGLAGAFVSVLLALSGVWLWRRRPNARTFAVIAAVLSIVFHVYAACPPHRNVGILVLLVGVGYGLLLLWVTLASSGRRAQTI